MKNHVVGVPVLSDTGRIGLVNQEDYFKALAGEVESGDESKLDVLKRKLKELGLQLNDNDEITLVKEDLELPNGDKVSVYEIRIDELKVQLTESKSDKESLIWSSPLELNYVAESSNDFFLQYIYNLLRQ